MKRETGRSGNKMQELQKEIRKIVLDTMEAERQAQRNRILYNTRVLMEQYREMRQYIENAISESSEMTGEEFGPLMQEDTHLESVRRTKLKTAMMIANVDRAMEELRKEYEENRMLYKYEAFRMHYIDGVSFEDVAEIQNCGKNSPGRWSKELIRKMSVKLFGVDGIEKW